MGKAAAVGTVPVHRLFVFADRTDAALMAVARGRGDGQRDGAAAHDPIYIMNQIFLEFLLTKMIYFGIFLIFV